MKTNSKWRSINALSKGFLSFLFSFLIIYNVNGQQRHKIPTAPDKKIQAKHYVEQNSVLLKQELAISLKDVTFHDFIEKSNLSLGDPIYVSCTTEIMSKLPKVTTSGNMLTLKEYLDDILLKNGFRYSLVDNILTIRNGVSEENVERKILKGKIVDKETGESLIGATVLIKRTNLGTSTDVNGEFAIMVLPNDELVISYMGKKTITHRVTNYEDQVIRLENNPEEMAEVVITGYATIDKNSFTGNAKTVKGEDILKVSRTNVLKALQMFDPSYKVAPNNIFGSDPNALPEIYIRGKSSLGTYELDQDRFSRANMESNPNTPTFILDGFEVSVQKIYDLDPNRIESMTILKDAAATAMYGSLAANGVVVITTKAPKIGAIRVNYNFTGTVEVPDLSDYNLMNSKEKLEAEYLSGVFDPVEGYDQTIGEKLYWKKWNQIYVEGVETDWMSKPLRNAFQQRHSLVVESGTEKIRYNFDLNYIANNGVMKGSKRDNVGAGFNVNILLGAIRITNMISYTATRGVDSPFGTFSDYTHQLPYNKFEDENGTLLKTLETWGSGTKRINPLYEASLNNFSKQQNDEILNNLQLRWNPLEGMFAQVQVGLMKSWQENKKFIDPKSANSSQELSSSNLLAGDLYYGVGNQSRWNTKFMLSFNKGIGLSSINFNVNAELSESRNYRVETHYRGFASGTQYDINHAAEVYGKPSKTERTSRKSGINAILNYSYNNIYLSDFSIRYEGASIFGKNQQSAPYWSAGLGLNVHNYDFLKDNEIISRLKLRATYGNTGNMNFEPHMSHNYFKALYDDWYITGYGTTLYYLGNPNLKSERTNTIDLGVDLSLFNERVVLSATYYDKHTKDMITDVTVPSSSGFTTYKDNMGETSNKGYEFELYTNLITTSNWNLGIWGNYAHNENRLEKIAESMKNYNNRVNDYYADYDYNIENLKYTRPFVKYEEGGSLNAIYGMRSLGIDPATGKEIFQGRNGNILYEYNPAEQSIIGNTEAKGQGAFGINIRYRNLTLSSSFQYEFGGDLYNETLVNYVENARIAEDNVDKRVLYDRWQKPGDIAPLKDIKDRNETTRATSRFVQRNNWVTLNSLTLQYDFPSHFAKALCMERIRVDANCGELFRWSTVKQERGLSYPFARNFNLTLMVSF
ncbi:MAG: SusC/RagA family TonB-linked outer membrane protein [Marinifilaceae bacterium]